MISHSASAADMVMVVGMCHAMTVQQVEPGRLGIDDDFTHGGDKMAQSARPMTPLRAIWA
jgi:hypothetical protein